MRGILLILILVIVLAIGAFATGLLNLNAVQPAQAPTVASEDGKLKVKGGQPPKLQVEAGKIAIGTGQATVPVPRLEVRPAGGGAQQAPTATQPSASAQPAPDQQPAPAQQSGVADSNATER